LLSEGDEVDEQIFSFRDTFRIIFRYRRVAAALGLVGLLAGLIFAIAVPQLTSAKSLVLLPDASSNSGVPVRSVATDVQIAMTPTILVPAARAAGVSLPFTTLIHRVVITGLTDDVMQVVAESSSGTQAERLADAIGTTFDSYASTQAGLLSSSFVTYWRNQATTYEAQIALLTKAIATDQSAMSAQRPGSAAAASYASIIANDTTDLNNTNLDLKAVNLDIAQAQLNGSSPSSGAIVLERATTVTKPSALRIPTFGLIGLLIGLLVGMVAAFGVGRKDRRLRLRDEIARATGAPVLASLSALRHQTSEDLLGLLDHLEPNVIDKANLRRLLDELGVERRPGHDEAVSSQNGQNGQSAQNGSSAHHDGVGVHAIVLAGDDQAVAAASEIPAFAASIGLPVALVVAGSSPSTQQLAIACAARDPLEVGAARPNLLTYASTPGKAPGGVSLAVTLEVVDPVTLDVGDVEPAIGVPGRHETALLVVSSGYAKPEDLEVVALAAEHHGRPLLGVVIAGPESSDKTSGLLQPRRAIGANGPKQLAALRSANR
jgi:capsular polysaccharide biosynthesis protein